MTLRRLTLTLCALLMTASAAWAQETEDYFRQNCISCHTIGGGRLTGPDLKNVSQRQERDWLVRFMRNPRAMINSGDPYAQQLLSEARNTVMPNARMTATPSSDEMSCNLPDRLLYRNWGSGIMKLR